MPDSDILLAATKRLVEVDDEKLARVRSLPGTTTLGSAVDAAVEEVRALDRRRRALLVERGHEDPRADPDRRQAAWRWGLTPSAMHPSCPAGRKWPASGAVVTQTWPTGFQPELPRWSSLRTRSEILTSGR